MCYEDKEGLITLALDWDLVSSAAINVIKLFMFSSSQTCLFCLVMDNLKLLKQDLCIFQKKCVCVTHTHTHTHIYIYIYIYQLSGFACMHKHTHGQGQEPTQVWSTRESVVMLVVVMLSFLALII